MNRLAPALTALLIGITGLTAAAAADPAAPGAAGVGDPYFPRAGNGGYDVAHYRLWLDYDPETDRLEGTARIRAAATQALSSFNLDLDGLEVRSITVDGSAATWTRDRGELTVTPAGPLSQDQTFTTVVGYDGVPVQLRYGPGVIPTDDGALDPRRAAGGVQLVPGQRPPDRQGGLHRLDDRAGGTRGDRQRCPRGRPHRSRGLHLDVERRGADGPLPGHRVHG